MNIREAQLVEVDPIDGDKEIWFYTDNHISPYIITLKDNMKPDKIFHRIEIGEYNAKMVRMKKLEKEKNTIFNIVEKMLIGGILI